MPNDESGARLIQALQVVAAVIVPDPGREALERLERLDRVRATLRMTVLRASVIDHLLDALKTWEPPEDGAAS